MHMDTCTYAIYTLIEEETQIYEFFGLFVGLFIIVL